ncbi:uncharacterized protein LOC115253548 [Aedes albopictus]|uniref:Uncharacterized protein n=1 Tax=Aedes albopictus TaxID=7160 RepID=A0ABM1YR64_AEDAL
MLAAKTQETIRFRRSPPMDNVLVGGTFNFRLGGRSDRDRTCYCFRRINLLLMVFRLICFVCYNLFRGALWQYLVVLDAVQRCNQLRKNRERGGPPKRPLGDTNQCSDKELLEEEEENMNDMSYDNSWIEMDDFSLSNKGITSNHSFFVEDSDENTSSDKAGDNELFVSYNENTDNDHDCENDDYDAMIQYTSETDPLERVLRPFEIDWDAPLHDEQSDDETIEDESFCDEEEFFIDDDCHISKVDNYDEFGFWTQEDLYGLSLEVPSDGKSEISSRSIGCFLPSVHSLESKFGALPMLDDDVLAAITGVNASTVSFPRENF